MTNRFSCNTATWLLTFIILIAWVSVGCKREEEIVRHRIPKQRSGLGSLRNVSESASTPVPGSTDRMVVALYQFPDATWFFKITGPSGQVAAMEEEWKDFLETVEFVDGQPQWELPQGWSEGPEKPMRFRTLVFGDFQPPLELAISSLGPNQDLLLNVNRWRQQMGLDDIGEADLERQVSPLNPDDENPLLFDVQGRSSGNKMPPFANRSSERRRGNDVGTVSSKLPQRGVKFESPEGWESGRTSAMVPVRLTRTEGDASAQITVVVMPAAVNEWAPNAKRWAGEIGLSNLNGSQLDERTRPIDLDGENGQMIRLVEEGTDRATIAAMIKKDEDAWFLKLTGDKSSVINNEQTFSEFLKSVRLPSN